MPWRGFGSAPCATKHAALCISKKNPTKITLLPLPSACFPISGALNGLFGGSGPVFFFISRSWQSCSPPAGAAGKPWKRVVMQERQRPAGRKDHRSGGNIFSLSARLLAGFPPRAAEPPADPSPIRRGDRHPRRLLHGRGWDFGNPSGVPPHAPAQPQPYETSANPRQQGAKELGEKSGLGIC